MSDNGHPATERTPVELRDCDSIDDATLENIWIADQPVGILMKSLGERVATLEDENEHLRERLDETHREAKGAKGVAEAKARADGAMASKKERALQTVRNELVRRAALQQGSRITLGEVKDICKPQLSIHNQTVYDAWDELTVRWSCFSVEDTKDGGKSLVVEPSRISDDLIYAVETDLSRDDLSKRLMTRREGGVG